jgi:transmembrane sensor
MSANTSIVKVLWRYKQREDLSEDELSELKQWLEESPEHEQLFADLSDTEKWDKEIAQWEATDPNATWNKISARVKGISPELLNRKTNRRSYLTAASILFIVLMTIAYLWMFKKHGDSPVKSAQVQNQPVIAPAKGSAILIVSNGNVIPLDSLQVRMSNEQGTTEITKTDSNTLTYKTKSKASANSGYNTLTTPKGSQYHVILSDGTSVWLNALSSLKFPVEFSGSFRNVELAGEAYFDVVKNKEKPFIVETARSLSVKVLGTHFNIKAYPDDKSIDVTLLEGSILAGNKQDSAKVKPGETLSLNTQDKITIKSANLEQVSAWRSRLFWFNRNSFEEIMKDLSRWYDIDVHYKGEIKDTYTGILPVNLPLSDVLGILGKGDNVHFTIEDGNKVTVQP